MKFITFFDAYFNIKMSNWAKIIIGDSRSIKEVENESVDLVVTSPPYWHIKDYGAPGQIGYGETLHEYLIDLYYTWSECFRVIRKGGRLCINVGDQFARSIIYGRYKVIPLHAEFISQCEKIGFDFMGSIIWQKKTTMNTTGGANIMGSYPFPTNGIIEIDYEYIHIFKKAGKNKKVSREIKELSKLSKQEWKEFFSGHWHFGGARQAEHEAVFPDELPRRLIRMFTFVGDTVLDPFLGSGTTAKVALELGRNVIGYEINEEFLEQIKHKLGIDENLLGFYNNIKILKRKENIIPANIDYTPSIKDIKPKIEPNKLNFKKNNTYKIVEITPEGDFKLDSGLNIKLLGVKIEKKADTFNYFHKYLLGKRVNLKFQSDNIARDNIISAYVFLENNIFINSYLIKSGLGSPDLSVNHKYKKRFIQLWNGSVSND